MVFFGCLHCGVHFLLREAGVNGDLGCPPCGVHFLLREAGVNGGLWTLSPPGVPVDVLLAQPRPGVPVGVLPTLPRPGVPVINLRHHRRPVHLILPRIPT